MRKELKAGLIALGSAPVLFLALHGTPPAPLEAQSSPSRHAMSFRIVFGEKQERPKDYSGSLSLTEGKVAAVTPWRFFGDDALTGEAEWKLHLKQANFENQPDRPRPLSTPGPMENVVPAGVNVTVEAPETATVRVKTARGQFEFPLRSLSSGSVQWFENADVWVQRTPSAERISPAGGEEHDHPSLTITRKGVTWVIWQAYQNNGDHVYARYSTGSGWSQPVQLTAKGDVYQSAIAEDGRGRVWAVWSERQGQDWDLYTRAFDGGSWSPLKKLTSSHHPNAFHRLTADRTGALHLVWIGYENGQSHVYYSKLAGDTWPAPREISGPSAWAPDAAADSQGNLYVAWDSYRTGNYDIFLRRVASGGTLGEIQQVTRSPRFQAHASVAVDKQDRPWLAWDESGSNWGKDWNRDDTWRGTTLYSDRQSRVAVLDAGRWKEPADIMAAVPDRYNRYIQTPKLTVDGTGRVWAALQLRTSCGNNRTDFWAANGHWEWYLTSLEGGRWSAAAPIPETGSRNEAPFALYPSSAGPWMVWAKDNRPMVGPARQAGPPSFYEVDAASICNAAPVVAPLLAEFRESSGAAAVYPTTEAADVARMRAYRSTAGGSSYQIVRGDFHRHTEISTDGAGDGSLDDYFRYMLDAAAMDTGIITDHNAGNDNEYTWWRTEKAHDLYLIPGRYTPLFGYERSVPFPNGHRNVVFARRGVRTLPISIEERQGRVNSGPILYPYLKQHRGICMLHSLATDQGSDYRDNDPEVEPLVEIYQGYHANYEHEGAPRSETAGYVATAHGKFQPSGFYWNALAKGYKLGVESSSDHISTHSSYTLIYTPDTKRESIVESMRRRHAYGATDNILIDYTASSGNRTYMMGDSFSATSAPKLFVKVTGTYRIEKVELIKNGKFVFLTEPRGNSAQFTFVDNNPGKGAAYYYVRVLQLDRNMAWSSPIFVNYGN